eukprot:2052178-Alexandrium_andersonii.AAC.1
MCSAEARCHRGGGDVCSEVRAKRFTGTRRHRGYREARGGRGRVWPRGQAPAGQVVVAGRGRRRGAEEPAAAEADADEVVLEV